MKGFVLYDKNDAHWGEVPDPVIKEPFSCIIKPQVVSTCTTDVHFIQTMAWPALKGKAIGHEVCGVITEVGPEVKDFKVGDRVCLPAVIPDFRTLGTHIFGSVGAMYDKCHSAYYEDGYQGPFAERMLVYDADMDLGHIPDNVSWEQAIMVTDMMTTGFTGIQRLDINYFGATIVVIGIGPVGLMGIAAAQLKGAARIIGVGHRPKTVELAKKYGMTDFVDYQKGDIVEQVMAITGGKPVDGVLVAGYNSDLIGKALAMIPNTGVVSSIGVYAGDENLVIPMSVISAGVTDKKIHFSQCNGGRVFCEQLLGLIAEGRVHPEWLADPILHGFDKIEDGLKIMAARDQNVVKPIVICDDL